MWVYCNIRQTVSVDRTPMQIYDIPEGDLRNHRQLISSSLMHYSPNPE